MARPRPSAKEGFSLIEVMVALAIFTLAAAVLAASYLNVLRSYNVASQGLEGDRDVAFARQELLKIADLPSAEAGDEFDTPDNAGDSSRHVKWVADIVPFAGGTATAPTDLFTVTLTVSISGAGGQTRQSVDTFSLLRPTWSEATARSTQRKTNTDAILKLQGKEPGGR